MRKYGLGQNSTAIETTTPPVPTPTPTTNPTYAETIAAINSAAASSTHAATADLIASSINKPTALYNLAASLAAAYHGYKRNNDSIAWGLGWMFLPNLIELPLQLFVMVPNPVIMAISTLPLGIALTQGFAKPLNGIKKL